MISLLLFAGAGVLCYVSPNLELIIVGRVIQGFAAGLLQPLVMLVLFQVFPPEKRGLAMGMFSMGVTVALGLAPTLGGIAIDAFSWRATFIAPVPACLLAILLGVLFLPKDEARGFAGKFDLLGFALINVTVFCWFTMLGNGQRWGWESDKILALALATFFGALAFWLSQMRRGSSTLDLALFRNGRFAAALAVSFLFGFGNFATVYSFPIFGQIVQDFTPTIAGSMLLPGSLAAGLALPFFGRLSDVLPATWVMAAGLFVIAVGVALLAGADPNTTFWYVVFALLLGRLGSALVSPAINSTAVSALPPEQMRKGAGVVNLSLMLGGSTGISVYVATLERRIEFHAVNLGATQTPGNSAATETLAAVKGQLTTAGLPDLARDGVAMHYLDSLVVAQANMLGFQDGFVALTIIALLPLVPVAVLALRR